MKSYISEFLGTFFLVLFGCGAMVALNFLVGAMSVLPLGFTTLAVAIAFGTTMTVMYYTFEKNSGSHFNPAVSLAVFLDGGFNRAKDFIIYMIMQFAGAIAAIATIWLVTGQKSTLGQIGYGDASPLYLGTVSVAVVELIASFAFVLIYLAVKENENTKKSAGLLIGLALTAVYAFSIPYTSGGVNPARILAPAVFTLGDTIKQAPILVLVPFLGAALAFLVFRGLISDRPLRNKEKDKNKEPKEKKKWFKKKNKLVQDAATDFMPETEIKKEI